MTEAPGNPFAAKSAAPPGRAALWHAAARAWDTCRHGDRDRWLAALAALPVSERPDWNDAAAPRLGPDDANAATAEALRALRPWRKGPLELAGVSINTEWRSDWKWQRVVDVVDWQGAEVLDVGCGNGYFGWRMLGAGARRVIGIDPTWVFVMQWLAGWRAAGRPPNWVLPLRVEDLSGERAPFDVVSSMGVLYHRRDPLAHLRQLRALTSPGGQVLVETLVIDVDGESRLQPRGRYARMRNVHDIPSPALLERWMREAGLSAVHVVDVTPTTIEEQRSTEWMTFESLPECLDATDPTRTVEGHPAPVRAVAVARA